MNSEQYNALYLLTASTDIFVMDAVHLQTIFISSVARIDESVNGRAPAGVFYFIYNPCLRPVIIPDLLVCHCPLPELKIFISDGRVQHEPAPVFIDNIHSPIKLYIRKSSRIKKY